MEPNHREQTDPNYRPWSWIAGFAFAALVVWLMFELSLQIGG
jgi:hypothetical protein